MRLAPIHNHSERVGVLGGANALALWFWRDKEGREVDVLIAEEGELLPLEIKLSAHPDRRTLASMAAIERSGTPLAAGAVVCLAPARVPLTDRVQVVPACHIG